jgi:hypothetical protein
MKIFKILFILTTFANDSFAQSCNQCCTNDSISYTKLNKYLYSKYEPGTLGDQIINLLVEPKNDVYFCSLIVYSKIFDFLLSAGLDLEYDVIQNPPGRETGVWRNTTPEEKEHTIKIEENLKKNTLYRDFLDFNELYNNRIIIKYYADEKSESFKKNVDLIINSGGWEHPTLLKSFLLSKYKNYTLEEEGKKMRLWLEKKKN